MRHGSTSQAPPRRMATERRLFLLVLSSAIPATLFLIWPSGDDIWAGMAKGAIAFAFLAWILVIAGAVRGELLRHTRTLSNLVEAIRRQDHSLKGAGARESGELGELYRQINGLTHDLKLSRQTEQELLGVLEKVVGQINVAIFVFDSQDRIRLANEPAGALLKSSASELAGVKLADTVLAQLPVAPEPKLVDFRFPGGEGRWQIRERRYRHQGRESRIVFIADLKQVLADEETAAWQRLIRVISHEVNNSLTPITSLCQTLAGILEMPGGAHDADVREGLNAIAERARGLQDFISAYARLARLPEPDKTLFPAADLAGNLRRIFDAQALEILPFPDVMIYGDPVHLEQALINLIKNGLEANPRGAPAVRLSCESHDDRCEFHVRDHGPGVGNPDNLFVPFYTTKAQGAGIGLVLCRQIAARHHGQVSLENRVDGSGAIAKLILPLPPVRIAR